MADEELEIPDVPEAKPEDPEDVSWALSTAEAMWARGDHLEGVKWIRKAAEAASEAEDDMRALELAKAAADLTAILGRRSRTSAEPAEPMPAPTTTRSAGSTRPSGGPPSMNRPSASPPAPGRPSGAPPAASASSRPGPRSAPPVPTKASQPPRGAPRPLTALVTGAPPPVPASSKPSPSNRPSEPKKNKRRSRDGLEGEARAAGVLDTSPQRAVDGRSADRAVRDAPSRPAPPVPKSAPDAAARAKRRGGVDHETTLVGSSVEELRARELELSRERAAKAVRLPDWDSSPTQMLSDADLGEITNDRKTSFGAPPAPPVEAPRPATTSSRAPAIHDPEIQTSQAVRVVVWRDANGVHVAPAGTIVSSITIDAVLVVLEPSADLTAWLSRRDR